MAGLAGPNTSGTSLDGSLTAERAVVLGVLLHLQLLGLSSQRRTISDTVLTSDTDLLSSLSPGFVSDLFSGAEMTGAFKKTKWAFKIGFRSCWGLLMMVQKVYQLVGREAW